MKFIVSIGLLLGAFLNSAQACPGASAEIPLAADSCNSLSGKPYEKCVTEPGHSVGFGQLTALTAFGHGMTLEGRTFLHNPSENTWCESTPEGCLQVYPRPDDQYGSSVLVGFCKETDTSEVCKVKGLPAKGSARKSSKVEIGYVAFTKELITITASHDKDGYAYAPSQKPIIIDVTPTVFGRMFGLRFEAKIYDPTLRSLGQTYELASNKDISGASYRGLPRMDEAAASTEKPLAFGLGAGFKYSGGCGGSRGES